MRIELQPAYILHTRPYRDTSLLVDFFTPEFGRIGAVARGVRQGKGNKRVLFNPFVRLLISLQGKTDLKLLTAIEADGPACHLSGAQLYSGFYLNELLVRLLPEMDAHPPLYYRYQQSLQQLRDHTDVEPLLRDFEFAFLQELGYAIDFFADAHSGAGIAAGSCYWFDTQAGFYLADNPQQASASMPLFQGKDIIAMAQRDFVTPETRQAAKRLSRMMLQPLLGNRPLRSRELFASLRSE